MTENLLSFWLNNIVYAIYEKNNDYIMIVET